MKYSTFEQVRIISADSFAEMEQKFNEAMIELNRMRPRREILEPYAWAIFYTDEVQIPETISEEHELAKTEIHCVDCRFFDLILNRDGTENRATKHARCRKWECSIFKDDTAKDMCYRFFAKEGGK